MWIILLIASLVLFLTVTTLLHRLKGMGALATHPLGKRAALTRYAKRVVMGYSWDADRCTPVGIIFFTNLLPIYVTRDVHETIDKAFVKGAHKTLEHLLNG